MLIVLSPAKSLDYETPIKCKKVSHPLLMEDAAILIDVAREFDIGQLMTLMNISTELATLNVERFKDWSVNPEQDATRPAAFAFNGDAYDGLGARTLNASQLNYLQNHLRILSGLYGVLRPLDLIQAYRLEMGRPLKNPRGKNLYAFWGSKITQLLNDSLNKKLGEVVINLASEEYFKVVKPSLLKAPVITPIFKDYKNGEYKIISFFAKRARGLMVRYCVLNNINDSEKLKSFDLNGYSYCEEESDQQRWVYKRNVAS